jgi:hypothetical protein
MVALVEKLAMVLVRPVLRFRKPQPSFRPMSEMDMPAFPVQSEVQFRLHHIPFEHRVFYECMDCGRADCPTFNPVDGFVPLNVFVHLQEHVDAKHGHAQS